MKSIIKSITKYKYSITITTKSGVVRVYQFDSPEICNEYYMSLCHDNTTMTICQ